MKMFDYLEIFRFILGSLIEYSILINLTIVRAVHPVFFMSFLMAVRTICPVLLFPAEFVLLWEILLLLAFAIVSWNFK